MSRYTQRRRGLLSDRRVMSAALGVLAVAGVVALLPQASDASPGEFTDNAQLASNGVQCIQVGSRRIPVSTDGRRHRFDRNPCRQPAGAIPSASASPVTAEPVNGGTGQTTGGGQAGTGQNTGGGQSGTGQNAGGTGQNTGGTGQGGSQAAQPT